MRVAKQFGADYWDGDRKFGYGGFKYDGRYRSVADGMVKNYDLKPNDKILDIGCGKGFLLHELGAHHSLDPYGIDISSYAIKNAKFGGEISVENCADLSYEYDYFDFTYSINVFHNLGYKALKDSLREMVRVTKENGNSYICVESYRNEQELTNLQCWALTCSSFYTPDDWLQIYEDCGYKGDYEFIYFT